MKFPVYTRHPLSAKYGDMSPEELKGLEADIRANGLNRPIALFEGKVLDGWHRYTCLKAIYGPRITEEDFEHHFIEFDPEEEGITSEAFVKSENVHRRHLTLADRISIAAAELGVELEDRGAKAKVAKAMGISAAAITKGLKAKEEKAKEPKEKAAPTLEGLQKRRALLQAQLDAVDKQIDELQSSAKPKPTTGRAVARPRRTR